MREHDPSMGRRALLGAGLAAGAGAALAGCTSGGTPPAGSAPPFDPASWESVRAQFALDPAHAQFAAYVLASHPAPVRRAVEEHRRRLDTDTAAYLDGPDREQAVREAAAAYLGGRADDVALTDSTTMGLGLLYGGLRLLAGQDVLTTEHDFYATHESLRLLAGRTGAEVRRARLYDDPAAASADGIVSRLKDALRPRTRVVAVTWVHSGTGVRLPVREIARMIAEANAGRDEEDRALLCVDGVHGFGALADGVADLDCDFLASGTHKWLYGPRGTGVLWGRAWDALRPVVPSFSLPAFAGWIGGHEPSGPGGVLGTPGGYHSFEHRWALGEAFAFHRAIGKDRVAARIAEQAARLKEGLAGLRNVRLITPRDPGLSAGLVCCAVVGVEADLAVLRLRERHRIIAGVTPYREAYLRFGPGIVTTPEEVDRAVKAVATLE
ncbi:aminotransferase class V-fold PLP-dependent enzyme [Planomonospora venezuelensis]|uniref:Selenocysteine lyase/cysteine desulfurase n=1 Tax=Planomonospora venezuelensis TaxID=1999 RepID=A0A841D4U8_PLAVE|nr:aminotransferase class V-fold PLP-dependent enzyme [Planomonospora venezuelensis]MBB5963398.1 selenocysteine lyase/cysteine desulfurase [Planomonospora venezuelensis]GIN04685.1 class V aminotransferase [Planomonospora venezuelensis]